jgi:hypothetical protein
MTSQSAQKPPFDCDLRRLGKVKRGEVGRRFVLGAAASLLAGVVTQLFGPQAGGLFLAFPAILLATLTLLEKKEGRTAAVASSEGAVLGAIGLAVFAFVFEAAIAKSASWPSTRACARGLDKYVCCPLRSGRGGPPTEVALQKRRLPTSSRARRL